MALVVQALQQIQVRQAEGLLVMLVHQVTLEVQEQLAILVGRAIRAVPAELAEREIMERLVDLVMLVDLVEQVDQRSLFLP